MAGHTVQNAGADGATGVEHDHLRLELAETEHVRQQLLDGKSHAFINGVGHPGKKCKVSTGNLMQTINKPINNKALIVVVREKFALSDFLIILITSLSVIQRCGDRGLKVGMGLKQAGRRIGRLQRRIAAGYLA